MHAWLEAVTLTFGCDRCPADLVRVKVKFSEKRTLVCYVTKSNVTDVTLTEIEHLLLLV